VEALLQIKTKICCVSVSEKRIIRQSMIRDQWRHLLQMVP